MDLVAENRRVWIDNHPELAYAPGRVENSSDDGLLLVVDDDGSQFKIDPSKAESVDPACLKGVDDLLLLGDFNEAALLHNIRVRQSEDKIYTCIGTPILISVNPYQNLPGLYSSATQKHYRHAGSALAAGQEVVVAPHLYSVADSAYRAMLNDRSNQSIIISGESGAGKTEATKRILAYMAEMQKNFSVSDAANKRTIEQQVLDANPVLEAFGNAKTVRNDNSSRFGKFVDVEFDGSGRLVSAQINNYLLEKCRICFQQPEERNYHIFYQLCRGASSVPNLAEKLHLRDDPSHYEYTQVCDSISGVDDYKEFEDMVECMVSLGFTIEERDTVFRIVAAVLHLGNLEFSIVPREGQDGVAIKDASQAELICSLLGLEQEQLSNVLQHKTLEDPLTKKVIQRPQDMNSAIFTRHAMAKVSYARLFDWLVWRINQSILGGEKNKKDLQRIGLLDIYGFEVFDTNSFEQLCINFANEKLQQHFNTHMFTQEQQLYTKEGITWSHIEWQDNQHIIDTLARKPAGLFSLVDSECVMPSATDQTLLAKIYNSFKNNKVIFKPTRFASMDFAIAHYAGDVVYNVETFLEKNTDKLHSDIMKLFQGSSLEILKFLFSDPRFAPEVGKVETGTAKRTSQIRRSNSSIGQDTMRREKTVSTMFREQLDQLVEALNKTNPRFIRCIKPNANKQPKEFDSKDVLRQLRCAGMLEAIRIRRAGYGVRRPFKDFFDRFRLLAPNLVAAGPAPDYRGLCQKLVVAIEQRLQRQSVDVVEKWWQIGQSKVFMKDELEKHCERLLSEWKKSFCVSIQKIWRGYMQKKRYREMQSSALVFQSMSRTVFAVLEYRILKRRHQSARELQAALRGFIPRREFLKQRMASVCISRFFRGWLCRSRIGQIRNKKAAEKVRRLREEQEKREIQENARLEALKRAQEIEAEKQEKERENMLLRQQLEEAKAVKLEEAKAVKTQDLPDPVGEVLKPSQSQFEDILFQERLRNDAEKDALQKKLAMLESANKELGDTLRDERNRADELNRTLSDVRMNQTTRGNFISDASSNALESLQMELKNRLNLGGDTLSQTLPPQASGHALSSALVSSGQAPLGSRTSLHENGRKTLANQRAMFEKLKMEFNEAEVKADAVKEFPAENLDEAQRAERLRHLEAEVRRLTHENARQKASALQFQEEAAEHMAEVEKLVDDNSKLQAELQDLQFEEARFKKKLADVAAVLEQQTRDMANLTQQKRQAEDLVAQLQAAATRSGGDQRIFHEQHLQLEKNYTANLDELENLRRELVDVRRNLQTAQHMDDASKRLEASLRTDIERLTKDNRAKDNEISNTKRLLNEVMNTHAPNDELEKWKQKAHNLEKQYKVAIQYNKEMTSAVGHITQAASERGGDWSEIQQMNSHLQREHERKDQELKMAQRETQDVQSQLDNVQSSCSYFQNKYKSAAAEVKKFQEETRAATEKADQFAQVAAQARREVEQLRAQMATLQAQNAQLAQRGGYNNQQVPSASQSGTQNYFRGQALSQLAEVDLDGSSSRATAAVGSRLAENAFDENQYQHRAQQHAGQQEQHIAGRPSLLTQLNMSRRSGH